VLAGGAGGAQVLQLALEPTADRVEVLGEQSVEGVRPPAVDRHPGDEGLVSEAVPGSGARKRWHVSQVVQLGVAV
jgi:hypothetical protein